MNYKTSAPDVVGVYATRVPIDGVGSRGFPMYEDRFMYWDGKRWCYLYSDQNYRGEVLCHLGPLPRINSSDDCRLDK